MLTRALISVLVTLLLVPSIPSQNASKKSAALTDALGDPLPDGAIARLGTLRFKHTPSKGVAIESAIYSPDGTKIASLAISTDSVRLWEVGSGKEITGPWASSGLRFSAIAFTPDSAGLAVGVNSGLRAPNAAKDKSLRNTVNLYDIAKAAQSKTISGPMQLVSAIGFADGGKTLVAAGDGAVRWWDLASGKEQRAWQPFADEPPKTENNVTTIKTFSACALSPDASAIALQVDWRSDENRFQRSSDASTVNEVIGYELPSGKKYWQSSGKGGRSARGQFAFSGDGKRLAIVVGSDRIELRNGVNGKLELAPLDLKAHVNGRPGAVALSADGRTLALASGDSKISLFNLPGTAAPRKFAARAAHNGNSSTQCLSFAPGDNHLLVGVDSDLQIYDVQTHREVSEREGHRGWVDHLAFTPDGTRLFTGLNGRGQTAGDYFGPNGEVYYLVSMGARSAQPAHEQGAWDAATWKRLQLTSVRTPPWPNFGSTSLQQAIYVGKSGEDAFRLFDMKSGQPLARLLAADKQTAAGVGFFSPSGKHFVHYIGDNRADPAERIYAVPSGKLVCKFAPASGTQFRGQFLSQTPGDSGENIAFSPDEKLVAQFGRGDGLMRIYDTVTGKLRHTLGDKLEVEPGRIFNVNYEVAFSADNRFLVSWSSVENLLHIWDMGAGTEIVTMAADDMGVSSPNSVSGQRRLRLTWSPDNRVLAMGENKIRLLEMATLRVRRELPGHADATVRAMAFSPASQLLATASSDTTVLIWDTLRPSSPPQATGAQEPGALEARWQALANDDASAAYAAILEMVSAPRETVSWIKERIVPEAPIDVKRVETLIEDLNDGRFKVRESASAELLKVGSRAAPAIEKALANNPTLETQRRLQSIRKSVTGPVLKGDKLQACRAIEVLEKMSTPEAVEVLRSLADGAAGGLVTTQARGALARLKQ